MNKLKYIVVFFFLITIWFQRDIFFDKYDAVYMHDYYSFSQWSIPLSSRIMGDADLFAYSGYNLTNTYKPFAVNPETPIFAKLFFGYSAKYLGNHHLASILFLVLLIFGMDNLAKNYFRLSKNKRLLLALLIFTSAEIQLQMTSTTLDLPQVMLFAWHLVFLFKVSNKKSNSLINIFFAGLLLGFMSATKPALYVPFILIADTWYLYKYNKLKQTIILIASLVIGYLLPYLPVILTDGLRNFLSAQKWVVNFYLSSEVKAPLGVILVASLSGLYKGWWGEGWKFLPNWNGSWALGLTTYFLYIFNIIKSKKTYSFELTNILISLGFVLLILIKLPFWPRYLIFLIPFYWLLILNIVKKKHLVLLLIFPLIFTFKLIYTSYQIPTQAIAFIQQANHEELYNYFSSNLKDSIDRNEFTKQSILEYSELKPNIIKINIISQKKDLYKISQNLDIIYSGIFGEMIVNKQIVWKRENSKWKIDQIQTNNIQTELIDKKVNAICLNPVEIDDWGSVNQSIMNFYKITGTEISQKTMSFTPRNYCIPIYEIVVTNYNFPKGIQIILP